MEEVNSFTKDAAPSKALELLLTATLNSEDQDSQSMIENPCLVCETVNPQDSSFKTVVIRNFR